MWTAARQIAASSEINTWKQFITQFAGKWISMTLVVIVGAYSTYGSKASVRRVNETNVAAQFENGMTLGLVLIVGAYGVCQQNKSKED